MHEPPLPGDAAAGSQQIPASGPQPQGQEEAQWPKEGSSSEAVLSRALRPGCEQAGPTLESKWRCGSLDRLSWRGMTSKIYVAGWSNEAEAYALGKKGH